MAAQPHHQFPHPVPLASVLTGVDAGGEQLLVLGLDVVVADLAPYSTLAYAHTFGEARTDATAAGPLADHHDDYLESVMRPDETWEDMDALYDFHAADARPFDADEFFGGEWAPWRPIARLHTASWLQVHLPGLFEQLHHEDTAWGFDYDPATYLAVADRGFVEAALTAAGHQVRRCEQLADLYLDPIPDWRSVVAGATHA